MPEVYRTLSTGKVLALSFEPGLKFDELLATVSSVGAREHVAHQLLDLYFREFFQWGLVQTDANFANFLFRPAAEEIVLLDFGATRAYEPQFREHYRALLLAWSRGNTAATLAQAEVLGLIDPRESAAAKQALYELLESVLSVFTEAAQPVDFLDQSYVKASNEKLKAYYRGLKHSAPPAQLLFLHRKLGGIYAMGKALRVRLDLRPYWQRLEAGERPEEQIHERT